MTGKIITTSIVYSARVQIAMCLRVLCLYLNLVLYYRLRDALVCKREGFKAKARVRVSVRVVVGVVDSFGVVVRVII